MKKVYIIIFFFVCVFSYSQTKKQVTPELVYVFETGKEKGQLGLAEYQDPELILSSAAIIYNAKNYYILDNINGRLLKFSNTFIQIEENKNINSGLSRLWLDSNYLVGGLNMIGLIWQKKIFYMIGQS